MPAISSNLYVKSFFAASVAAAMEQARRELGADALLLNSREAPPEARHLGEYEVVFGTWPANEGPAAPPPAPAHGSRKEELHHRIHELRQLMTRIRPALAPNSADDPGLALSLIDAGVDSELADTIARAARRRMTKGAVLDIARPHAPTPAEGQSWLKAAADEIGARFTVQPEIGRITALVGPPGSGKTSTLVKLAVNECLRKGRALQLITTDTMRIGGAEQLRTFATILGVPFQAVDNSIALAQAIDSAPANASILIDTPGLSAVMQQEFGGDLAQFLARRQDIDTHLVLTASMDNLGQRAAINRFQSFGPAKLIYTRMDEAISYGTAFSGSARTQKPLSFVCHGQSIPEDIQPAVRDLVIDSLVRQLPESLQAVA